ncbi:hypothetical protein GJ496_001822 [Pomphorhynchus laevis]|nr:hypothetical protein GJ496_001822 [Pomphorhynchus laevis]
MKVTAKLPHNADQPWHIDIISNEKYTLCDTYPSVIAYPSIFKPDLSDGYADPECSLFQIRDYRSKGRLPILSWYNKHNHATITRCSQPMSGFANRLCEADRKLFQSFAECNPNQDEALFIVDARPKINARANMTLGGGYEDYPEHNFEFLGIPNIHVMRESLKKLEDLVYPFVKNNKSFFLDLDNCGWLWYVKQLIEASCKIASSVSYQNISVVVHCSDGWDRTSQLTSLSMMMLDGYYRTIEGFMVLIEKEWSSFGHKFALRIGHGEDHFGDNERSPIFVQFIDAVYQYQTQAVSAFEFNEYFLITLLDHLYSCQFGNFLCNCEKERVEQNVYENTVSLWTYMLANKETFINPFYEKSTSNEVIIPNSSIRIMKLWSNYYCRYCVNFRSTLPDQIKRWKQLQKYKQKLQSDINDFKQQIYINSKSVTGEAMENDSCPLPENMSMISMDNQLYSSAIARIDSMLLQAELSMFPDMQSADIMQASEKIIGDDVSADHSDEHSINSSTTTEDEPSTPQKLGEEIIVKVMARH